MATVSWKDNESREDRDHFIYSIFSSLLIDRLHYIWVDF